MIQVWIFIQMGFGSRACGLIAHVSTASWGAYNCPKLPAAADLRFRPGVIPGNSRVYLRWVHCSGILFNWIPRWGFLFKPSPFLWGAVMFSWSPGSPDNWVVLFPASQRCQRPLRPVEHRACVCMAGGLWPGSVRDLCQAVGDFWPHVTDSYPSGHGKGKGWALG